MYSIVFSPVFRRCNEWNEYQKQLENQNAEYEKALCRKEQFIKHLEFVIDSQEEQKLESNKLNIGCTESNLRGSEDLEMFKNPPENLSSIVADKKYKHATAEPPYKQEIKESRYY